MAQRSTFEHVVAWITLPALAVVNLALIFLFRGFPISYLGDLGAMLWLAPIPGILFIVVALAFCKTRVSYTTAIGIGVGIGLGVTPAVFVLLRAFGLQELTPVVVSVLNVLLLGTLAILWRGTSNYRQQTGLLPPWRMLWGSLLFVTIFLQLYNFNCINFAPNGDLHARSLFAIDLPYLVGQFASLKSYPELRDLHQLATPMFYHDFAYIFLIAVDSLTKSELFPLTIITHPIFNYTLFAISTYALAYPLTHKTRYAALTVGAIFLLGSFVGTEQGSYALSPSFVWGSILFMSVLQCVRMLLSEYQELQKGFVVAILTALLVILSRSKISTYAVVMIALSGLVAEKALRRDFKNAIPFAIPIIVSVVVFLLSSSGQSPFMPAGDFLIGAPLLGYANHLSSILHIPLSAINPVSHGFGISFRQLLIIPYFLFHLLRFISLDGRMILVLAIIVFCRKQLEPIFNAGFPRTFFWLLVAMVPIGFFMPVLYSPAWYPLAFSFYAPLVGVVACTLLAVTIGASLIERRNLSGKFLPWVAGILLLASIVGNFRALQRDLGAKETVIPAKMIAGLRYLRDHSAPHDVIASRRFDLDPKDSTSRESFYAYSAFSERPVISEGAAYGALLGSVAQFDSTKGLHPVQIAVDTLHARRALIDSIYLSKDPSEVRSALGSCSAKFILVDKAISQHLAINPLSVSTPFFDNDALTIWKVRN